HTLCKCISQRRTQHLLSSFPTRCRNIFAILTLHRLSILTLIASFEDSFPRQTSAASSYLQINSVRLYSSPLILQHPHLVQVRASILPVQTTPGLAMLLEQFQVKVFKYHRLDVGRALGGDGVARERDVRWREDARLRVMNAQALDVGQVADAAGD